MTTLSASNFNISTDASQQDQIAFSKALVYLSNSDLATLRMQQIADRQTKIIFVHGEALPEADPAGNVIYCGVPFYGDDPTAHSTVIFHYGDSALN